MATYSSQTPTITELGNSLLMELSQHLLEQESMDFETAERTRHSLGGALGSRLGRRMTSFLCQTFLITPFERLRTGTSPPWQEIQGNLVTSMGKGERPC